MAGRPRPGAARPGRCWRARRAGFMRELASDPARWRGLRLVGRLGDGRWAVRAEGGTRSRPAGTPRGAAAAALHHRASGRPRALPDGLRGRARVGGRPDRRASLHRRHSSTAARRRRRDGRGHPARRPGHLPAHRRGGRWRTTPCTPKSTGSTPEAVAALDRARAEGRRLVAVGTTAVRVLETLYARVRPRRLHLGLLDGQHPAVHHPGLPVPGRRRADDQLPPAAHLAAGPGHGLRWAGPIRHAYAEAVVATVPFLQLRRRHAAAQPPSRVTGNKCQRPFQKGRHIGDQ